MPHIHEKIDFVADTYVVNKGAVLLRIHDKLNIWLPPGGHIELHEDPTEAALREVREEVGLEVRLLGETKQFDGDWTDTLAPRFMNRHHINETHEHISMVYFATSDTRDITASETEKSAGIRWFTREELADPVYGIKPVIQYYAAAALDAAKGS